MKSLPFLEAFTDITRQYSKVPKSEFLDTGTYPIIDQGKGGIAGYSDNESLVSDNGEVIIFGDHTRAVKFAEGRFALGADGTKVLQPCEGILPRFAYRWLQAQRLSSLGYSRHFKLLKGLCLPVLCEEGQRRVADILDEADALRAKCREAIAKLDSLRQSIFHEMFGNLGSGGRVALREVLRGGLRNGLSPSTSGSVPGQVLTLSAITGHDLDLSQTKSGLFDSGFHADQRVQRGQMLFCRGNGNKKLVGVGKVVGKVQVDLGYPDTIIAGDINADVVEPAFLQSVWDGDDVRGQIEQVARTTNGTFKVNQTTLGSITFPLPSLDLQREFASRIDAVERLKANHRAQLAQLDDLFFSLQDRAFKGEL